jgi:hypothetical protein
MNAETPPERGRRRTGTDRGESYTPGPSQFDIPAHRQDPAEADLRLVTNTIRRERSHWWIAEVRRHQASCDWCRRCDWTPGQAA